MGMVDAVLLALAAAVVVVWVALVPRVFRFDDRGVEIGFYFRGRHRLGWGELSAWRGGRVVLRLEFGRRRFRVLAAAYPAEAMRRLRALLTARFPEREIGG